MKVKHWLLIVFATIGILYTWHMYSSHNASGILSGIGVNK